MAYDEPWTLDADDFPEDGPQREQLRFALRYAVLAPSGHNTQPWTLVLSDSCVELRADRERALPVVDPAGRALLISCGAALGHLTVALRAFHRAHIVETFPDPGDPDLLARVLLTGEKLLPDAEARALLDAIPRRHSNRSAYEDRPAEPGDLMACVAAAEAEGALLHVLTEPGERDAVAALIAEGDLAQMHDPAFRRELAHWVKSRHGADQDGLSARTFGLPDALSAVGALVIRFTDQGDSVAAKDRRLAQDAPALAVLTTPADTPADWLAAGRALSRVLLTLTRAGLAAAFLNEPIEVPELRPRLRGLLPRFNCTGDGVPQLLMRIGYPQQSVPAAARRPLEDVLVER
ncbi:Acg family FMN-binding oxidoreductase [Rhodocista pekingensis]|uniref:Acg family FMN-binding oxidoreductase n=1 Tax=Rhodocista pekingensis TaxID=201185 RepID=A0ABW2KXB7_9PROT